MLSNLTPQLTQVVKTMALLPEMEQNTLAEALTVWLSEPSLRKPDADAAWERLFASPASQHWLEQMTRQVEEDFARGAVVDRDPGDLCQ